MHLICGEALYDVLVEPNAAASEIGVALRAVAGGSPFNVSVGMARLGVPVALATDLANDRLGCLMTEMLASENVDGRFIRRDTKDTALALITTDDAGVPRYNFLSLESATYAPRLNDPCLLSSSIAGLHLGSVAIVLPRSAVALVELAYQFADRALVSFDPNVRLSIVPDIAKWRAAIEQHRALAHVVKVSEEDIFAVYEEAPEQICRDWVNDRTALVVLTRGAMGASIFCRDHGRIDVPALETKIVDTVGAGDGFMAAILAVFAKAGLRTSEGLRALRADQLFELGRFAAAGASLTCTRQGPRLPSLAEVEAVVPLPALSERDPKAV